MSSGTSTDLDSPLMVRVRVCDTGLSLRLLGHPAYSLRHSTALRTLNASSSTLLLNALMPGHKQGEHRRQVVRIYDHGGPTTLTESHWPTTDGGCPIRRS